MCVYRILCRKYLRVCIHVYRHVRKYIYIYMCVCSTYINIHIYISTVDVAYIIENILYIYSLLLTHIYNGKKKKKRLSRLTVIFHQVAGASSKAPSGDPVPHLGPKADSIGI